MEQITVETLFNEFEQSLPALIEQYNLDKASVYEEEGENGNFYIGYAVKKSKKIFFIHLPFEQDDKGQLKMLANDWTIRAENEEYNGFDSLDTVFEKVNKLV